MLQLPGPSFRNTAPALPKERSRFS